MMPDTPFGLLNECKRYRDPIKGTAYLLPIVGGFDLDVAALRILEKLRLSAATLVLWFWEKAAVRETRFTVAKLGREKDGGLERLPTALKSRSRGG
jgi:hypothetical protein